MKPIVKKFFSVLTAGVMMCSSGVLTALPTDLSAQAASKGVTLYYDGGIKEVFSYNLDYLLDDNYSCTYSPQLAHMLMTLAEGAYNQEDTNANYRALGYDTSQSYQVGYDEEGEDPDNIGFTIGKKTTQDGHTDCLIVIRGTQTASSVMQHEWLSDLNVGYDQISADQSGYHKGFERAANEILKYVSNNSSYRYIITGHSRGAAVGNIVAKKITDWSSGAKSRVYNYNFAVPDPAYLRGSEFMDSYDDPYNNIFNISNALDPISMVPSCASLANSIGLGELWKRMNNQPITRYWGKFGNSYWFSDDWNNYYNQENIYADDIVLNIGTVVSRAATYHPGTKYLEFLRNEPDLLQFRIRESLFFPDSEHTLLDHLTYSIDGTVTITGCDGLLSDIEIPKKIEGKRVTAIGGNAFYYCKGLKKLTIPDSVISIGQNAFDSCARLKSFDIPDSITEIPYGAFASCSSLENVTIPDSITNIGDYAFSNCVSFNNIIIPESVTSIGNSAFSGCSSIEEMTIPESVTSIGNSAFADCTSLESIILPDSISELGSSSSYSKGGVFENCTSLRTVKLPSNLDYIQPYLFHDCKTLKEIQLPASVKRIGNNSFDGCSSLTGITLPDGLTSIGSYAFKGCGAKFKSVTIPASVTSIGSQAFGYSDSSRIGDFVIYGYTGSKAEAYANNNNIKFVSIGNINPDVTTTPASVVTTTTKVQPVTTTTKKTTTTTKATTTTTKKTTTTTKATTTTTKKTTTTTKKTTTTTTKATTTTSTTKKTTTTTKATTTTTTTATPAVSKVPGDADCSGIRDVADAVLLARFLAEDKEAEITQQGKLNADCNKSGKPDQDDVVLILKAIARLITL